MEAAGSPWLRAALDQVIGEGRWNGPVHPGLFAIRFPSEVDPGDAGWHVDGSYSREGHD